MDQKEFNAIMDKKKLIIVRDLDINEFMENVNNILLDYPNAEIQYKIKMFENEPKYFAFIHISTIDIKLNNKEGPK